MPFVQNLGNRFRGLVHVKHYARQALVAVRHKDKWRLSIFVITILGLFPSNTVDDQIVLIPPTEFNLTSQLELPGAALSVAWNPDGDMIAVSGEDGIYLYTSDYRFSERLTFEENPFTLSTVWSPAGNLAASLHISGNVHIWNAEDLSLTDSWQSHNVMPSSIAWSADGAKIAVGSWDGTVTVYDVVEKRSVDALDGQIFGPINSVVWHPSNHQLAFGSVIDTNVIVWDTSTDQLVSRIRSETEKIPSWSPDGNLIALAGVIAEDRDIPAQGVIYIWDVNARRPLRTLLLDRYGELPFYSIAWHPDGVLLAAYNHDQEIYIWNVTDGQLVVQLPGRERLSIGDIPSYNSLTWSPDGTKLADAGSDGVVNIWDAGTYETITVYEGYKPI